MNNEDLMQRKRRYLLTPKKELTERCLLIEQEIERLCNILDNIGYELKGIIRTTENIGITKNTGYVLSQHNIELLKNIIKKIENKDISIVGSDK